MICRCTACRRAQIPATLYEPPVLWTPENLSFVRGNSMGLTGEDADEAILYEFDVTWKGERVTFGVLAEKGASVAQVEDMAAAKAERELTKIMERLEIRGRRVPVTGTALSKPENIGIRRELAAVLRDIRRHARKRAQTTTGRLYQQGVSVS